MLDINWTFFLQIANVLVLMFVLQKLLFKPITKALDERDAIIKECLGEAKTAQDKAEGALKIIEGELSQAKQKASVMLSELRQQGMAEQVKIVEAAKEQGKLLIEKSVKEIEKSALEAKGILLKDAEIAASEITTKMLSSAKAKKEKTVKVQ